MPDLYNGDTWIDGHTRPHVIAEMDPVYAHNVLVYLLRRADRLEFQDGLSAISSVSGEAAADLVDEVLDEEERIMHPERWLLGVPLGAALMARIAGTEYEERIRERIAYRERRRELDHRLRAAAKRQARQEGSGG